MVQSRMCFAGLDCRSRFLSYQFDVSFGKLSSFMWEGVHSNTMAYYRAE